MVEWRRMEVVEMFNNSMSSREIVMRALEHKSTPRAPFSLGFGVNLPAKLRLMEYLGHDCLRQTEDFLLAFDDIRRVAPRYIGPAERELTLPDGCTIDIWGVMRKPVTYTKDGVYDEICYYPLAGASSAADLDAYEWPSPDWYDYATLPDIVRDINPNGKFAIMLGKGNIFESTWYMRGFEQILMDIVLEPDLIDAIMDRVTAFYIEYFERALNAARGSIDLVFTADDIAGQNGMLMSPDTWRKRIKPFHKQMNARLHEHGVKIIYHTDGAAHSVIDDLIDMGIDCWEALQLDAHGMDAAEIKKAAGGRLAFHGGISVQQLLPYASPEEVRAEVARLIRCLGGGCSGSDGYSGCNPGCQGGYIAAPSHAIQAGTPPENIIAMLQTARPDINMK